MSLFMFIFLPRELTDKCQRNLHLNEVFTYDSFKKLDLIPWFAQWNEKFLFKRKYYSISMQSSDFEFSFASKNVFKYELRGNFIGPIDKSLIDSDLEVIKSTDTVVAMNLSRIISDNLSRHQLYHLINDNIKSGECVEIYSQWLDWDAPDIWGPPKHTYELSLKEVFDNRKFFISTEENDLYIIHKP